MQKSKKVMAFLAACFLATGAAQAGTVDELSRVSEEIRLLKARLQMLQVKEDIAKSQANIDRYAPSQDDSLPSVRYIEGADGVLVARLVFANGSQMDAREGSRLPNGYVVKSIKGGVVTVAGHGRVAQLMAGNAPPAPANQAGAAGIPPLPASPATSAPFIR